jgi:hypothetical protein
VRYAIRGGLGNQALEMAGCLADAIDRGVKVDRVSVNVQPTDRGSIRTNHVARMFETGFPVDTAIGTAKFGIWKGDRLERAFRHRDAVLARVRLKVAPIGVERVLHVRMGDRAPASRQQYIDAAGPGLWHVIADDAAAAHDIASAIDGTASGSDALTDWRHCLGAREIVGPASSFTLSAAYFAPHKRVRMFRRQNGPRPAPGEMIEAIEAVRDYMDFAWI